MEGLKTSGKRYTQEQILKALEEIESDASMISVSRKHGVGIQTIYEWRKRYRGMTRSELAELKAMQEENRRLRKIVASMVLEIEAYKELQKGKW